MKNVMKLRQIGFAKKKQNTQKINEKQTYQKYATVAKQVRNSLKRSNRNTRMFERIRFVNI